MMKSNLNIPSVISFLQEKGGAGKTTLAINVADGLHRRGYSVLLADSDPMGSSRDWNSTNDGTILPVIGLDRETLPVDLLKIRGDYQFVIIDGAPQRSRLTAQAIKASDLVLIPVQPSPYDVWASESLVSLLEEREGMGLGPKAAFIVSRAIKNTKLSREVTEALFSYGLSVFNSFTSQLIAYPTLASRGFTVYWGPDNTARIEIDLIIDEILETYYGVTKGKEAKTEA